MRLYLNTDQGAFVAGLNQPQRRSLVEVKRGDSTAFALAFCGDFGVAIEQDATVAFTDFRLTAKVPGDLGADDFILADTSVAKTGTGSAALYTFSPSLNTVALNDLFILGGVKATPADATARKALTEGDDGAALVPGDVVRQVDTQDYHVIVAGATDLTLDASWSTDEPRLAAGYVDLALEASWTQSGRTTSTLPCTLRVLDDVSKGSEGVPPDGADSYPAPGAVARAAAAVVIHTDGTQTGYIASANTAAARGAALLAACVAGVVAEAVITGAGTFNAHSIDANGLILNTENSTLSNGGGTDQHLFDDAGGAIVATLRLGDVNYSGIVNSPAEEGFVVNMTNASSSINLSAGNIVGTTTLTNGGGSDGYGLAFGQSEGILHADIVSFVGGAFTWWKNGDMTINADSVTTRSNVSGLAYPAVYARVAAGATMTGKMWINATHLKNLDGGTVDVGTSNNETGSAQIYVNGRGGESEGTDGMYFAGCKSYIFGFGKFTVSTAALYNFNMGSGMAWISGQKAQGLIYKSGSGDASIGYGRLELEDWMDSNGDTDGCIFIDGGDNQIRTGLLKAVTANGIIMVSGKLRYSGIMDTSAVAAGNPVTVVGGTLIFEGLPRLIAASGQASILAGDDPVTVYGRFIANTPIGANVTAADGYTLDDGTTVTEYPPLGQPVVQFRGSLASNVVCTTATLATQITVALPVGRYAFHGSFAFNISTSGGWRFRFGFTGTTTSGHLLQENWWQNQTRAGYSDVRDITGANITRETSSTDSNIGSGYEYVQKFSGVLVVSVAGNVTLELAQQNAAGNTTYYAGGFLIFEKL